MSRAKAERDKIFERYPLSTDNAIKKPMTYLTIKKLLDNDYALSAAPINKKYDGKLKKPKKM